jgi:hypothetical protein
MHRECINQTGWMHSELVLLFAMAYNIFLLENITTKRTHMYIINYVCRQSSLTSISVMKRHKEHLTAGDPKGYINSIPHRPQRTLPTSCAAIQI